MAARLHEALKGLMSRIYRSEPQHSSANLYGFAQKNSAAFGCLFHQPPESSVVSSIRRTVAR